MRLLSGFSKQKYTFFSNPKTAKRSIRPKIGDSRWNLQSKRRLHPFCELLGAPRAESHEIRQQRLTLPLPKSTLSSKSSTSQLSNVPAQIGSRPIWRLSGKIINQKKRIQNVSLLDELILYPGGGELQTSSPEQFNAVELRSCGIPKSAAEPSHSRRHDSTTRIAQEWLNILLSWKPQYLTKLLNERADVSPARVNSILSFDKRKCVVSNLQT